MKSFILVALFVFVWILLFCSHQCSADCPVLSMCSMNQQLQVFDGTFLCNENVQKDNTILNTEPAVHFANAEDHERYLLLMLDPDAPSRDLSKGYYLHWLASGIQGADLKRRGKFRVNSIVEYMKPSPPAGSGMHRYQFLLYAQKGTPITLSKSGRHKFNVDEFLRANGLSCTDFKATFQFKVKG